MLHARCWLFWVPNLVTMQRGTLLGNAPDLAAQILHEEVTAVSVAAMVVGAAGAHTERVLLRHARVIVTITTSTRKADTLKVKRSDQSELDSFEPKERWTAPRPKLTN